MQVTRTFDILAAFEQKWPEKTDALASKQNGEWRRFSISEYAEMVRLFSCGLLRMGFKKGDKKIVDHQCPRIKVSGGLSIFFLFRRSTAGRRML